MSDNEREGPAATPRKKPSGLGRGLNALFGDAAVEAPVLATPGAATKAAPVSGDAVQHVSVGSIRPLPNQPRRHFDEAAIAELADSIDEPIRVYSSGMVSRLGFAVAVHLEPEVLLIDESLTVGHAPFQEKCIAKIAELHARGVTTLLVSHDLGSVARLCDRAMVLESHHIAFNGAPDAAVAFYRTGMA